MATLEITYHNDVNGSDSIARVIVENGIPLIEAGPEDLRLHLKNLADQVPYVHGEEATQFLRKMSQHLENGINGFTMRGYRII